MKKKWCKHIKWTGEEWEFYYNTHPICLVLRAWKACPICLSERPTETNIAAAKLQAEMDGDL
jgi:hypothetical protein